MTIGAIKFTVTSSVVGDLAIGVNERGCCLVEYADRWDTHELKSRIERRYRMKIVDKRVAELLRVRAELGDYLTGRVKKFSFPLDLQGTQFEMSVWHALQSIPYGQTRTYGEIAKAVDNPLAFQAVGRANGANPLAIVVPCHRVVRQDGHLSGYGGGVWRKALLLELEKSAV